jgi:serine protease Do
MSIRKILPTALVSFASAFAAVAVFNHYGLLKQEVTVMENKTPASLAALSLSNQTQPVDFRFAAASSTPSVVHIKSTFKVEKTAYGMNDPFRDFFGDDILKYFHGPNPYRSTPQVGTGSGVIVSEDGYIVTNNHVVENASEIRSCIE